MTSNTMANEGLYNGYFAYYASSPNVGSSNLLLTNARLSLPYPAGLNPDKVGEPSIRQTDIIGKLT